MIYKLACEEQCAELKICKRLNKYKLQLVYTVYLQLYHKRSRRENTQILWPCNAKIVVREKR